MATIIGVDIDSLDQATEVPGSSWVVVRMAGVDYKVSKTDFNSGTQAAAAIPDWTEDAIFNTTTNKYAIYDLKLWKSKVDDNQGNQPAEDAFWTEVSRSESSSIKEWTAGVYTSTDVVVKRLGKLIELINPTRPFESVDIEAEIANGDWRYIPVGVSGVSGSTYQNTYASVPAMIIGQGDQDAGAVQFVSDASKDFPSAGQGDPTVLTAGSWAEYVYLGTTNGDLTDYRKRAEEESLDVEGVGSSLETYADIPAMLADQVNQEDKQLFEVTDASKDHPAAGQGDPTIDQAGTKGWYRYKGVANGLLSDYVKVSEEEAFSENEIPDMPALSVKANPTNATGAPQDVVAGTAERIFARTASNTLAWIQATTNMLADLCVTAAKIAANAVGFDKFVQSTGNTVVGKIGAGTGNYTHTPIVNIYDGLPQVLSMRELTVNTLLDNGDAAVDLDCTGGAVVAQLDDPATVPGQVFIIMKIDSSANAGSVDPQTYNINGSTTDISLPNQYDYIKIRSTGSEYVKIGGNV